ncbi:elongator complex protein 4-like [Oscarella lobularis]|uniref:elongator complex protein 4-like n=1 Tax=Oscarella lobularis TaxID=121494 RepID=UPI003313EFAC
MEKTKPAVRRRATALPRGTRLSVQNGQLLVSTGVPSVDQAIGGGLAVGTVLLIEEDAHSSYSEILLRYFFAEGVVSGHGAYVASGAVKSTGVELIETLPALCSDTEKSQESKDDMKIAWRYRDLPEMKQSASAQFGHSFDLSRCMDSKEVEKTSVDIFDCNPHHRCDHLIDSLSACIDKGKYGTAISSVEKRNVLRIGIHSLGSPLWSDMTNKISILRFLYRLRGLVRSSYAVALVTIPTHLFRDEAFVRRVEHLSDVAIHLESFEGSEKEKNPVYKDYHGLFHICRLSRLNSLACHLPETTSLAFKLHRKKFAIEKLYLPPDASETASRSKGSGSGNCGSGTHAGKAALEF